MNKFRFVLLIILLFLSGCRGYRSPPSPPQPPPPPPVPPDVQLVDKTIPSGLEILSQTFGVAVSDINNDGSDDLVIVNHGKIPSLLLNKNGVFEDHSHLIPEQFNADRHGVTAVDLDNDGDKDLVIAGGGADGIGPGHVNVIYQNLLTDTGNLAFEILSDQSGIAFQSWRARHLLPIASQDGSLIDLYLVCKSRQNCPNLYFSNCCNGGIRMEANHSLGLNQSFNSEGHDIFFDFDRDGDQDLLILDQRVPTLYKNTNNHYYRDEAFFQEVTCVYSIAIGDLNGDGYLDLYFGTELVFIKSDNISFNDREIHYVVHNHSADKSDRINFNTPAQSIDIDFIWHNPGNTNDDPLNIFIGEKKKKSIHRRTTITTDNAEGEPLRDNPGIYVWKNPESNLWHVEWLYNETTKKEKGKIMGESFTNLEGENLETKPANMTRDRIFINMEGIFFRELTHASLHHDKKTRSVSMCDLNNDGLLDIIGIRGNEQARYNGEPFIFINCGELNLEFKNIMQNTEDDIFQADLLVYGFFNNDGLLDIFFTNGYGLSPGFRGPYKLFINRTQNPGNYVTLELEGRAANRDAIGAEVELYTVDGDFLGYSQLGAGFNRTQHTHKLHFGLGQIDTNELKARIKWPGTLIWEERKVIPNEINIIKQKKE